MQSESTWLMHLVLVTPRRSKLSMLCFNKNNQACLGSYILRGIDVFMKFRLDNPTYFNFNNLFEISLNGALNRGVFKIWIYSKWP